MQLSSPCDFEYLLLLAVGDDSEHVLLADDQVLDVFQLELVAGVLRVEHLVADGELHRNLLPVVEDPAGSNGLHDPFLRLLARRVRQHDPALCLLLPLDRLQNYPVAQRPQLHAYSSAVNNLVAASGTPTRGVLSTRTNRVLILRVRLRRFQAPLASWRSSPSLPASASGPLMR